jgi:hypothetical protein
MASVDNLIRLGGTQILRHPNLLPLEKNELKKFAPTIFQKRGIEGVSDNYGHVDTWKVIEAMNESGYQCVEVRQSKRRDEGRMPFTKHMLKFKPAKLTKTQQKVGDVVPQVVMLNSHDRSSGFHLYFGLFRLVCSNGMIVSAGDLVEPIKVRHSASMVGDIIERSGLLVKGADGVYQLRQDMHSLNLTQKQQVAFATKALEFRPPRRRGEMSADSLLHVRRKEDDHPDLWTVFNRVQENMLAGGVQTVGANERVVMTKGIGRIERDVQVNSALWELAVDSLSKFSGKKATVRKGKALTAEDILS